MKREYSDDELSSAGSNKRPRLGTCHRLDVVVGPPSNFETFDVNLDLICEHSRHFQKLYCEGTIGYGVGKAVMLPNLTPEFFRAYLDRLEDSSFNLAEAVKVGSEGVDSMGTADEDQVLKQLHRLCTWWRGADFLEDYEFKNAIMGILVEQDIERCPEVLSELAYLVAGEDMKECGLRRWWVDSAVTVLCENSMDEVYRKLPKDIVVDLLKAQFRLNKVEDYRNRLGGAGRYYEQNQGEAGDAASVNIRG